MNRSLKIVRVRLSHYDRIEEETSSFVGAMGAFYSKAREMLTPQATCLYISKPKGLLWHDYGVLFSCTRTFFFFLHQQMALAGTPPESKGLTTDTQEFLRDR